MDGDRELHDFRSRHVSHVLGVMATSFGLVGGAVCFLCGKDGETLFGQMPKLFRWTMGCLVLWLCGLLGIWICWLGDSFRRILTMPAQPQEMEQRNGEPSV
jgi:hypothetical protein